MGLLFIKIIKEQFSMRGRELFSVGGGVLSWYLRVSFQGYQKVGRQLILTSFSKESDN